MKKNGSHVGFVLSFVVFVTFLIFIYSVLIPTTKVKDKPLILEKIAENLLKNISSEIITLTISVSPEFEFNSECVSISDSELISRLKKGFVVKSNEKILDYQSSTVFKIKNENKRFLKIFSSDSFEDKTKFLGSCESIDDNFEINSVKIENYSFEKKINLLFEFYERDYENLKTSLEIPEDAEFEFDFYDDNGNVIATKNTTALTNIYSKKISVQYINNSVSLVSGEINLRIW